MNIKSIKTGVLLVAGVVVGLSSCKKEEDTDFAMIESDAFSTTATTAIDGKADRASFRHYLSSPEDWINSLPSCATVTENGSTSIGKSDGYPKTVTIDFGTGCTDANGVEHQGKIIVETSAPFEQTGATRTITFDGFQIDGRTIEGQRTEINEVTDEATGYVTYTFTSEMTFGCHRPEGGTTRTTSGTKTWISGFDTETTTDNIFQIVSTTTGNGRKGTFTRTVTEPLIIDESCKYPTQGVVTMECKRGTSTIDFGNGACDNIATVTRNGESFELNLDEARVRGGKRH